MSHAAVLVAVEGERSQISDLVDHEMAPFDENNECFRDGSRWDWFVIGGRWDGYLCKSNKIQVKKLDLDTLKAEFVESANKSWDKAQKEQDPMLRSLQYGVKEGMTKEQYVAAQCPASGFPSFYAFLHKRSWHERARMGWWGSTIKTECEIAHPQHKGKCVHSNKEMGAKIISWNDDPAWTEKFYDRFVRPLSPDTWLVTVDFHV